MSECESSELDSKKIKILWLINFPPTQFLKKHIFHFLKATVWEEQTDITATATAILWKTVGVRKICWSVNECLLTLDKRLPVHIIRVGLSVKRKITSSGSFRRRSERAIGSSAASKREIGWNGRQKSWARQNR